MLTKRLAPPRMASSASEIARRPDDRTLLVQTCENPMVIIPGPLQPLEAVGKHMSWLGESISSIARGLNLDRRTVREFLRVGAFPERAPRAIGAVDGPAVGELAASVG